MIYLFEDRKGRMDSFYKASHDSDLIREISIECKKSELIDYLSCNCSDAVVVIFHLSYHFNDVSITNEDVKSFFIEKKIPFVYFSGGLDNSLVRENNIITGNVNSGDLYSNLSTFLNNYASTGQINISLLVNGKEYLLNSLLELQNIITMYLFNKRNDEILTREDIYDITDLVEARLSESELSEDRDKLLKWLKDESNKESFTLKKQTLLRTIQRMNDKIFDLI